MRKKNQNLSSKNSKMGSHILQEELERFRREQLVC